ncbi:hypothetical protein QVD17_18579 [Tagetes erecta]|uniref:Uncharacterized protein n=1 Tax=Tagetes erecta TaxID=13708 RepID=A0AAD8KLH6_TARER|nr:hypothetical protein QVD17_18579 [Tagetes erecta]
MPSSEGGAPPPSLEGNAPLPSLDSNAPPPLECGGAPQGDILPLLDDGGTPPPMPSEALLRRRMPRTVVRPPGSGCWI